MKTRKIYKELKELRKHMVDPTEEQLKDYYEARNYIGCMVIQQETAIRKEMIKIMVKKVNKYIGNKFRRVK